MNHDIGNSEERDGRLRVMIGKGAELAGGTVGPAVGAVIGSLFAGPVGTAVGGGIGAAATMAFKAVGHELSSRFLSPREQTRIGGVFALAAAEIVQRCQSGECVRDDGFFDTDGGGRSDAEEVWESTLLKSQREAEEKKLPYMAHWLANLAFNSEISAAMAHQMTKAAESMTYRQFCILRLSVERERFKLRNESYRGQAGPVPKELYQILYEYHDLYNRGLINYGGTAALSLTDVNPGTSTPQALGADIFSQMRLYLIPDDDLLTLASLLR